MNRVDEWEAELRSSLSGWQIYYYENVSSTMDLASALIGDSFDLAHPALVLAKRQSAGRGRQGRPWNEAASGLYATAVFPSTLPVSQYEGASLVVACAVRKALSAFPLFLKWPNDLLSKDGKKVGGILLELHSQKAIQYLSVGLGINLSGEPTLDVATSSLHSISGLTISPLRCASMIFPVIGEYLVTFEREGFSHFRSEWLHGALNLNSVVTVKINEMHHRGVLSGVNERGQLLLNVAGELLELSAGEVIP